ncbi:hypothetical protein DFA_02748 [Cavenderia fasciculata]|uniref:Peptidase C39-like domain-containing protein n=1 Tax=Cavenderia fasciculata TaxID=261658 RepID=F4PI18_CACFS|nr:uncharacterized protein DFA_02748 [Cavenderia fasciculata]EGG24505.1 hypothetical protein DFA_02748 [Cavenderia fasciculata]|eukprot:XP_004362356.1 hypothetical protein DFA_02748 [Cavenderia fasciculata]
MDVDDCSIAMQLGQYNNNNNNNNNNHNNVTPPNNIITSSSDTATTISTVNSNNNNPSTTVICNNDDRPSSSLNNDSNCLPKDNSTTTTTTNANGNNIVVNYNSCINNNHVNNGHNHYGQNYKKTNLNNNNINNNGRASPTTSPLLINYHNNNNNHNNHNNYHHQHNNNNNNLSPSQHHFNHRLSHSPNISNNNNNNNISLSPKYFNNYNNNNNNNKNIYNNNNNNNNHRNYNNNNIPNSPIMNSPSSFSLNSSPRTNSIPPPLPILSPLIPPLGVDSSTLIPNTLNNNNNNNNSNIDAKKKKPKTKAKGVGCKNLAFGMLSRDRITLLLKILREKNQISSIDKSITIVLSIEEILALILDELSQRNITLSKFGIRLVGSTASMIIANPKEKSQEFSDIDLSFYILNKTSFSALLDVEETVIVREVLRQTGKIISKKEVFDTFFRERVKVTKREEPPPTPPLSTTVTPPSPSSSSSPSPSTTATPPSPSTSFSNIPYGQYGTGGDDWSLISMGHENSRSIDIKFVKRIHRPYAFSIDSFQIILDPIVENYKDLLPQDRSIGIPLPLLPSPPPPSSNETLTSLSTSCKNSENNNDHQPSTTSSSSSSTTTISPSSSPSLVNVIDNATAAKIIEDESNFLSTPSTTSSNQYFLESPITFSPSTNSAITSGLSSTSSEALSMAGTSYTTIASSGSGASSSSSSPLSFSNSALFQFSPNLLDSSSSSLTNNIQQPSSISSPNPIGFPPTLLLINENDTPSSSPSPPPLTETVDHTTNGNNKNRSNYNNNNNNKKKVPRDEFPPLLTPLIPPSSTCHQKERPLIISPTPSIPLPLIFNPQTVSSDTPQLQSSNGVDDSPNKQSLSSSWNHPIIEKYSPPPPSIISTVVEDSSSSSLTQSNHLIPSPPAPLPLPPSFHHPLVLSKTSSQHNPLNQKPSNNNNNNNLSKKTNNNSNQKGQRDFLIQVFSIYGNFHKAKTDLENNLLVTVEPKQIRRGIFRYCHELAKGRTASDNNDFNEIFRETFITQDKMKPQEFERTLIKYIKKHRKDAKTFLKHLESILIQPYHPKNPTPPLSPAPTITTTTTTTTTEATIKPTDNDTQSTEKQDEPNPTTTTTTTTPTSASPRLFVPDATLTETSYDAYYFDYLNVISYLRNYLMTDKFDTYAEKKSFNTMFKYISTLLIISTFALVGSYAYSSIPSQYVIPNIFDVYQRQSTKYNCGDASMHMVFNYWGKNISQSELDDVARTSKSEGTSSYDIVRAGQFSVLSNSIGTRKKHAESVNGFTGYPLGMNAAAYSSDTEWSEQLKACIANDIPVIVLQHYLPNDLGGHFRVVVGYNDNNETFTTLDPWGRDNQPHVFVMSYSNFTFLWNYTENDSPRGTPFYGAIYWPIYLDATTISTGNQTTVSAKFQYGLPIPELQGIMTMPPVLSSLISLETPQPTKFMNNGQQAYSMGPQSQGQSGTMQWVIECPERCTGQFNVTAEFIITGNIPDTYDKNGIYYAPYDYMDVIGNTVTLNLD